MRYIIFNIACRLDDYIYIRIWTNELLLVHAKRYTIVLHYAKAYIQKYTIICKYVEHNAIVSRWTRLPQQCIPETIQNSRTPTCSRQALNLYIYVFCAYMCVLLKNYAFGLLHDELFSYRSCRLAEKFKSCPKYMYRKHIRPSWGFLA